MTRHEENEVPDGAAVFPEIPAELGINPLLLAVVHAVVFLNGSEENVVHPGAAEEAINYLCSYLQRLQGPALDRVREDMDVLARFGREERWPRDLVAVVSGFLEGCGVGVEDEEEEAD